MESFGHTLGLTIDPECA